MRGLVFALYAAILLTPSVLLSQTINFDVDRKVKEGAAIGIDNNSLRAIPENIMKDAKEVYDRMQRETMPKVEAFKNTMTIDNNTGALVFNRAPDKLDNLKDKLPSDNSKLLSSERLYIFISSSMPAQIIENYSKYTDLRDDANMVFILRGCIPSGGIAGCGDFKKTLEFVKKFILSKDGQSRRTSLWIDPVLFRKYGITEVPSIVYANNVNPLGDMGSEGDYSRLSNIPSWWKSVGDWSIEYHLQELYNKSKAERLKKIIDGRGDKN